MRNLLKTPQKPYGFCGVFVLENENFLLNCIMDLQNSIIDKIFKDLTFSVEETNLLRSKLEKIELEKGDFLLKENMNISHMYYVEEGCLRTYFLDTSGKEHTIQFAIRDWFISDYIALFANNSSIAVSYIQCIKKSTLYKISKDDFENLCDTMPQVERFHRKKLEKAFASLQNRVLENLTLTAKERYLNFISAYPNIEQSVKNYHIASYLGITTESLSRIRKEIANN